MRGRRRCLTAGPETSAGRRERGAWGESLAGPGALLGCYGAERERSRAGPRPEREGEEEWRPGKGKERAMRQKQAYGPK